MSGLDKIIEQITQEARNKADQILVSAREAAEKALASGKKEADQMAAAIQKQSEADVEAAQGRIRSMAELKEKRLILQAKQDKIEEVFAGALDYLTGMNDAEYFDVIRKMLARYASGQEGRILFSAKDLKRLPEDMEKTAAGYHLTVSREPVKIRGGFILDYGDIEENCSFEVLLESAREELQDKVGQLLFQG